MSLAPSVPGVVLAIGGAALMLLATFLPWISVGDDDDLNYTPSTAFSSSLWQLYDAADIVYALLIVGAIGLGVARLVTPRTGVLASLATLLAIPLIPIGVSQATEVMSRVGAEDGVSVGAGAVFALVAGVVLVASVTLTLHSDLARGAAPKPRWMGRVIGLIMLASGGALVGLVQLLPVSDGVSVWEASKVADIVDALVGAALAGVVLWALHDSGPRLPVALGLALGGFLASEALVGSVEALARSVSGAAVIVNLVVLSPLFIGGTVLVAIAEYPRRGR